MIAVRVAGILGAFFAIWFLAPHAHRDGSSARCSVRIGGEPSSTGGAQARVLPHRTGRCAGSCSTRSASGRSSCSCAAPGLVLMYSATNDSLVMPSYPLDPASASDLQVPRRSAPRDPHPHAGRGCPLCGAMIRRHVAVPVSMGLDGRRRRPSRSSPFAVVYCTFRRGKSHKAGDHEDQRASRCATCASSSASASSRSDWLKVYNHNLVAGRRRQTRLRS